MDNENNSYPDFVPNQILTNNQLNQLRKYLDHQNRLGRVRLTGTGIVCGLNVNVAKVNTREASINITTSGGFGVSSEGYFLELENSTALTHWREYTDPNRQKDGAIIYQKWQQKGSAKKHINILELSTDVAGAKAITPQLLQDRVLVLYLEQKNEQLDSCLVTDCDSKGVNVRFTARILLVKKQDLQPPLESCESKKNQLIRIPRLHTVLPLTKIQKSSQINEAYNGIVQRSLKGVFEKIKYAHDKYATFLNLDEGRLKSLENLNILLEESSQYSWDILNDIADAYNEFIIHACELLTPCLLQQDFPRHLMLGAFDGEVGYRNIFTPSRVRNVEHSTVERAQALFLRILILAESIDLAQRKRISITPSHTRLYPLGKRALPFYYSAKIEAFWQPQMCCTMNEVWSYHFQQNLSKFDYESASFLRIEGHIGKTCDEVIDEIKNLQHSLNLEFNLLAVGINRTESMGIKNREKESLVSLASDIFGIEHTAGAVKGGTFILLCDEKDIVVADFSLVGRIPCCRNQKPQEPPAKRRSIEGTFTDEDKTLLVNGQVVLINSNNQRSSTATTNKEGYYLFPRLRAGSYTVQASINMGQNEDIVSDVKQVQLTTAKNEVVNLVGVFVDLIKKGGVEVFLSDSAKQTLFNATIQLQHTEDKGLTYTLKKVNNIRFQSYLFKNIKVGKYHVKVNADGYQEEERITRVVVGEIAQLMIELTKIKIIDASIIDGERLGAYQAVLSTLPASVKRSVSAKSAHGFIHKTLPSEATDEVVFKQYQALVSQALKALGSSTTNKPHYKTIITTASLAFLDRLIMSNPKAPSEKAKAAIKEVKQALNNADIPFSEFKKQWDTSQLTKELKLGSIDSIIDTLR